MTAPRAPFTAPDQPIRDISTPLEVYNLGTVDYVEMWDRQAELAAQRADGLINDQLLFLEHPNTYTAGKRTQPEDRPTNGLPVVGVDLGGPHHQAGRPHRRGGLCAPRGGRHHPGGT